MIFRGFIQKARGTFYLSLFLFLHLSLLGCDNSSLGEVAVQGKTMGTYYNVKVVAPKGRLPNATQLKAWVDAQLEAINQSMSTYIPTSELSRLNKLEKQEWIDVSDMLFEVLLASEQVSEVSNGAFDITVMPLVNLWGFGPGKHDYELPTDSEISVAAKNVGFNKVELNRDAKQVRRPFGVTMDLSAVAKGYAADKVASILGDKGFTNVLVEIGGELVLRGNSRRGDNWRIGVETPNYSALNAEQSSAQTVMLSDRAMATSGDYRNYYELKGKRYSHTIDPSNGKPITHNTASVTVIARSCAEADAMATAFNVMGAEKGLALAKANNIAVYFIVSAAEGFKVEYSPAFKQYLAD